MVIPMVDNIFDFTGIDTKIADEVYEAFNEVFKKFPNLKNRINYVGSIENAFDDINKIYKLYYNGNLSYSSLYKLKLYFKILAFANEVPNKNILNPYVNGELSYEERLIYGKSYFESISVNELFSYSKLYQKIYTGKSKNIFNAYNIKGIVFHEVGHILSNLLFLSYNEHFMTNVDLLMKKRFQNYSCYSLKNPEEFIAEQFTLYMLGEYTVASIYIGNYITNLYKKYENTKVFEYDDKYMTLIRKNVV